MMAIKNKVQDSQVVIPLINEALKKISALDFPSLFTQEIFAKNVTVTDNFTVKHGKKFAFLTDDLLPEIQSILLSYLPPERAALVLSHYAPTVQLKLILSMANLTSVRCAALLELDSFMKNKFVGIADIGVDQRFGQEKVAIILNYSLYMNFSSTCELLDDLQKHDKDLKQFFNDQSIRFDDIQYVSDEDFVQIFTHVNDPLTLLTAFASAPHWDRNSAVGILFKSLPEDKVKEINLILNDDTPIPSGETETEMVEMERAQQEIIKISLRMAELGMINLHPENIVIKPSLFAFEHFIYFDDLGLKTVLDEINDDIMLYALRGADNNIIDKIFINSSSQRSELLRELSYNMGPVRVSECRDAANQFMLFIQKAFEEGRSKLKLSGAIEKEKFLNDLSLRAVLIAAGEATFEDDIKLEYDIEKVVAEVKKWSNLGKIKLEDSDHTFHQDILTLAYRLMEEGKARIAPQVVDNREFTFADFKSVNSLL